MRRTSRRVKRTATVAKAAKIAATSRRGDALLRRKRPAVGRQGTAAFYSAFQLLVGEIFRLNGRLLDVADALAHDLQITPTHWQIIAIIRDQPLTIPAISRRVGLRRQSVQHNITQLLARRFVEQAVNPEHRRASLIRLTPAGRALMRELHQRQSRLTRAFTAGVGLTDADLASLAAQLRRMRESADLQQPA